MPLDAVLQHLAQLRGEGDIVVTTMSAAREWPRLCDHPLDFHFVPSTMGGGPSLGLGLAIAQPQRHVLVLTGDGSLLMNLGALVTIVDCGVTNLTVAVLDNGIYEVTGGQKTAAQGQTDYAGLARSCGFPNVAHFTHIDDFHHRIARILQQRGPRFLWLKIEPNLDSYDLSSPGPMADRITRFRAAIES